LDIGGPIVATTHYGKNYNNAFWDGRQIVFGDGDGTIFKSSSFALSLGMVASQLALAVIGGTVKLEYKGQSGALNTHFTDVFSTLVEQWKKQESADKATWLVGAGLLVGPDGGALRSLKAPGTAYDSPIMGKDPQPAHMKDFVTLPLNEAGDLGGVHVNSGIPNRAFYEVAKLIGGNAWERPGKVWYESLLKSRPSTTFSEFAQTTFDVAGDLYGAGKQEQEAVKNGWEVVGITVGKR
jgi:Zn-dependent metalloprotease